LRGRSGNEMVRGGGCWECVYCRFHNLIGELSVSNLEKFSKDELEEIFRNEYERD